MARFLSGWRGERDVISDRMADAARGGKTFRRRTMSDSTQV
jgi:hypothetical protein